MQLLGNYRSTKGEDSEIFVNEELEPVAGDYDSLCFEVGSLYREQLALHH